MALFNQAKKSKRKGSKGKNEKSQPRKKDLRRLKCFIYYMNGHYASHYPDKEG